MAAKKYPRLLEKALLCVISSPLSYLVELSVSHASHLLSKARNRVYIVKRGDLRQSLTLMEPNIKKKAQQHQAR